MITKELREKARQCTLSIAIELGYLNINDIESQLKGKMYTDLERVNEIIVSLLSSQKEEYKQEASIQLRKDNDFIRAIKKEIREEYKNKIEGLRMEPTTLSVEGYKKMSGADKNELLGRNNTVDEFNSRLDKVLKEL